MNVATDQPTGNAEKKKKSPSKLAAQHRNNKGPCPGGLHRTCKHPPIDHRPIANTRRHFCYAKSCMTECG